LPTSAGMKRGSTLSVIALDTLQLFGTYDTI
jgi:hypothetical protein